MSALPETSAIIERPWVMFQDGGLVRVGDGKVEAGETGQAIVPGVAFEYGLGLDEAGQQVLLAGSAGRVTPRLAASCWTW